MLLVTWPDVALIAIAAVVGMFAIGVILCIIIWNSDM